MKNSFTLIDVDGIVCDRFAFPRDVTTAPLFIRRIQTLHCSRSVSRFLLLQSNNHVCNHYYYMKGKPGEL